MKYCILCKNNAKSHYAISILKHTKRRLGEGKRRYVENLIIHCQLGCEGGGGEVCDDSYFDTY